jgi:hypothetical protein
MFHSRQRCRFARRSGDHQTITALLDMKIDQTLETRVIDPIITIKRGHQSDQTTLEHEDISA